MVKRQNNSLNEPTTTKKSKTNEVEENSSLMQNQDTLNDELATIKIMKKNEVEEKTNDNINNSVVNCVAGSSKSIIDDRYTFNFWKKCESKAQSVEILNLDPLRNLKINQLNNGIFEKQSLVIRITYKSEVKETTKGKCVSFLGIDETSEISLVSFGKLALHLFNSIEINCIYSIQNFLVYEENTHYPSGSGNKLQIKANANFIFENIDDDNILPKIKFNFQSLATIKSLRIGTSVDLIGVLVMDHGVEVNTNSNHMRDLSITDQNKDMIIATLWGVAAEKFKGITNSVIVIRKALVSSYKDIKKINCTAGTLVWMNSKIPEVEALTTWFVENYKEEKEEKDK